MTKQPAIADLEIRTFLEKDRQAVITLWHDCGLISRGNNPDRDIDLKMRVQPELFFVGVLNSEIVATAMAGFEGHRGWVNYLASTPVHQRSGIGRMMMQHVEDKLTAAGCPKINLQIRSDNSAVQAFYESLGYVVEPRISMGKRISQDD